MKTRSLAAAAFLTALLAAASSAAEVGIIKKQRGAVRRGGASGKNPMDALMDGLANMFKDMANMLGGGSKNGG